MNAAEIRALSRMLDRLDYYKLLRVDRGAPMGDVRVAYRRARREFHPDAFLEFDPVVRGAIDRFVGGVGLRRGRRLPEELREGEALDFWRVEALQPNRMLRLRAEMKLPGQGWLQFEAKPGQEDQTELVQTAFFAPKGLFGLLYWYLLYPIHRLVFSGLIRKLAQQANALHNTSPPLENTGDHMSGKAV